MRLSAALAVVVILKIRQNGALAPFMAEAQSAILVYHDEATRLGST